ncbi:hypothetical protein PTKIN_Ptkin05aG0207600 [Pterospermum kingtungense]
MDEGLEYDNTTLKEIAYVHEYWSALALLSFEVVVSAGQKAKEEAWDRGSKHCLFKKCLKDCPVCGRFQGNYEDVLSKMHEMSHGIVQGENALS